MMRNHAERVSVKKLALGFIGDSCLGYSISPFQGYNKGEEGFAKERKKGCQAGMPPI